MSWSDLALRFCHSFCYIADSVSESTPITALPLTGDPTAFLQSSRETKRHLLAALFSAIVPGAGQLFLGQRRKGTILLLILAAVLIGFWPLRLLRFYSGLILLSCVWTALYLYAACSAHLARNVQAGARPSKWWLVGVLPLTVLTLGLLGRTVTRAAGFRSFSIPSTSMEKTILQGDTIVADMRYYDSRRPYRREAIIFLRDGTFYVKRVVGIGGDSIQGKDNKLFVNGKEEDEPYVEHIGQQTEDWLTNFGPITIPNGTYFVLGDNRDFSFDSRATDFGLVNDSSVVGKPLYVYASGRAGKGIR